jgi:tryptophanyl-tRNA synthetase
MIITKGNEHTEEFRGKFRSESDCASCKKQIAQEIKEKLEKFFSYCGATKCTSYSMEDCVARVGSPQCPQWKSFWNKEIEK